MKNVPLICSRQFFGGQCPGNGKCPKVQVGVTIYIQQHKATVRSLFSWLSVHICNPVAAGLRTVTFYGVIPSWPSKIPSSEYAQTEGIWRPRNLGMVRKRPHPPTVKSKSNSSGLPTPTGQPSTVGRAVKRLVVVVTTLATPGSCDSSRIRGNTADDDRPSTKHPSVADGHASTRLWMDIKAIFHVALAIGGYHGQIKRVSNPSFLLHFLASLLMSRSYM